MPNYVPISTAEIQACLKAAHRKKTTIDSIRLTAHSRGYRGLVQTLGGPSGGKATIDLASVDRISVFDSSYSSLGNALKSHETSLTAMQDKKDPKKFDLEKIRLYDATVGNISGFAGLDLKDHAVLPPKMVEFSIQGLAYLRFTNDALLRTSLTSTDLVPPPPPDPLSGVLKATNKLLKGFPARGMFSTRKSPSKAGMTDISTYLKANHSDLQLIGRPAHGLKDFLLAKGISTDQPWSLDAHHFLAAELGHEAVE